MRADRARLRRDARRHAGPGAVVVGLDNTTGLQTARLLSGRGVAVTGIATDVTHPCARTHACRSMLRADTSGAELVDVLIETAAWFDDAPVLVPCTDGAVLTLSAARDALAGAYRLGLPSHDVVQLLSSKDTFGEYAAAHGFRVPATATVADVADLDLASSTVPFPCTIKPAFKDQRWLSSTSAKGFRVDDATALREVFDRCRPLCRTFVVQQWIAGPPSSLVSCNCYYRSDGTPVTTFVARKLRQWPREMGVSSLGVSCRDDAVRDETVRLFTGVGFHGLGYVEMKRERESDLLYLIETNVGRPTGRSAIAEAGGVELVHAMYCDLAGLPLPEALEQRDAEVKWLDISRDVRSAFGSWRDGELTAGEWLASLSGPKVHAVVSLRDPVPFLADIARFAARRTSGATKRSPLPPSASTMQPTAEPDPRAAVPIGAAP